MTQSFFREPQTAQLNGEPRPIRPLCPHCEAPMGERNGRNGIFWSCPRYPSCRGTRPYDGLQTSLATSSREVNRGAQNVSASNVTGTPQQDAIWHAIEHGTSHLIVLARAGTGKTFTATHATTRLHGQTVGFCAFNSHIARELKTKMPPACSAFTLHSLGFTACKSAVGAKLEEGKVRRLLKEILTPVEFKNTALTGVLSDLVSLCKGYLCDGRDTEHMAAIADRHDIDLAPSESEVDKRPTTGDAAGDAKRDAEADRTYRNRLFSLVAQTLELCRQQTHMVDFDDMVWLPIVNDYPVVTYDVLMVDEAQDLSRVQQELALRACPAGRIVIIGDDRQAIYGFRGADSRSIARMQERLESTPRGCQTLPLTLTRRCPQSHVALAQTLVDDFRSLPEAPVGEVGFIPEIGLVSTVKPGDMILCRTTAPLIAQAYALLRRGVRAIVRGRDIGKGMQDLIERLQPNDLSDLSEKLAAHFTREVNKATRAGKSQMQIEALYDRRDTMVELMADCETVAQLNSKIGALFGDFHPNDTPDNAVLLSTIHRAKGLEADTVWILRADLLPHPAARRETDREQEHNIAYVAVTRAKQQLYFVDSVSELFPVDRTMAPATIASTCNATPTLFEEVVPPRSAAHPTYQNGDRYQFDWLKEVRTALNRAYALTPGEQITVLEAIGKARDVLPMASPDDTG